MRTKELKHLSPVSGQARNGLSRITFKSYYRKRSIFEANSGSHSKDTSSSPYSMGFIGDLARMANYAAGLTDSRLDENIEVQNFMRLAWKYYAFYLRMIGRRFFEKSFLEFVQFLETECLEHDSLNWNEIWDFSLYIDSIFQSKALIPES